LGLGAFEGPGRTWSEKLRVSKVGNRPAWVAVFRGYWEWLLTVVG